MIMKHRFSLSAYTAVSSLLFSSVLPFFLMQPLDVNATASCSLNYNLQADLTQDIPDPATDADFMEFAWNHFLALNAPTVGGQISVTGDNTTQWSGWSSTADMLNQSNPGPSGSRYYPEVCKSIPNYQNYRAIQQVGKVDDTFLEAQVRGLSENPVIDSAGHFLRYEILVSPAMYNEIIAKQWNDPTVLAGLNSNIIFSCGDVTKDTGGGDPANPNMGAIALKIAWRDGNAPGIDSSKYHMEDLLVYTPAYRNSTNQETCELKSMAMVGMHMGHKTVKQPNWIWATYEHDNNAPDCASMIPGTHAGSQNTDCPADSNTVASLNPNNCGASGNQACASCNTPPARNGTNECINPYNDPDGNDGWCLDLPPNPIGGISQLCRQVPVASGYCSNDLSTLCQSDGDCNNGGTCSQTYPAANDQNTACTQAINDAPGSNGQSPWLHYRLISSQWEANSYGSCQNAAQVITSGPTGQPINQSVLREQVTLSVNSDGTITSTRPILGNSSMESYDRPNCIGCHTRSYLNGVCSNDNSKSCSDDGDCSSGGTCTQYNTDLMYFLKLEVAQPPAIRLQGTRMLYWNFNRRKSISSFNIKAVSDNVLAMAQNSKDDPRCLDEARGTVKADLRFYRPGHVLEYDKIPLPCQGWKRKSTDSGDIYIYKDRKHRWGPCRSVVVKEGRSISVSCTGIQLPDDVHQLDTVQVSLASGRTRYCAEYAINNQTAFGWGSFNFFISRNNDRIDQCPDL